VAGCTVKMTGELLPRIKEPTEPELP